MSSPGVRVKPMGFRSERLPSYRTPSPDRSVSTPHTSLEETPLLTLVPYDLYLTEDPSTQCQPVRLTDTNVSYDFCQHGYDLRLRIPL